MFLPGLYYYEAQDSESFSCGGSEKVLSVGGRKRLADSRALSANHVCSIEQEVGMEILSLS